MLEILFHKGSSKPLDNFSVFNQGDAGELAHTDLYAFTTDLVVPGNALGAGSGEGAVGVGNRLCGLFAGGYLGNRLLGIKKYNYADHSVSTGTNLGGARDRSAGVSDSVHGYILGGKNSSGHETTLCDKYNYSNNTRVTSTAMPLPVSYAQATGNESFGIVAGGMEAKSTYVVPIVATTRKYVYASNSFGSSTALKETRWAGVGYGASTAGHFSGGYTGAATASTEIYTYATNAVISGASLAFALQTSSAAGNDTRAIIGGGASGQNVVSAYTNKYTYSTAAVTPGTSLRYARSSGAAVSSNPGGFSN